MIKNFIHKDLRKFYASGSTAGIQKKPEKKLRLIL
ncbi:MAG: proteic killer suppression protein, partial [Cocleimonas sp.]